MKKHFFSIFVSSALFLGGAANFCFGQAVVRGPYLQRPNSSGLVVRWRTDVPSDSRVRYGTAPDQLNSTVQSLLQTTEHEIAIGGLSPATKYYYSFGTTTSTLGGGDAQHYFYTSPATGSEQRVRLWVFGDAQEGTVQTREAVRDAYYNFAAGTRTDMVLLLGDNASFLSTDADYTGHVFGTYGDILRNTPLWSTFGNHEGFSSVSLAQTGPYYDAFTFPTAGEAGGAPSGTEAYYSFDYANIHFICLNSHDIPRQEFGAMMNWLRADLAQNQQKWTIAYFHHPPYSKGSHDSDNPGVFPETPESAASMREMREIALPILEAAGVDLVLTGHSHTYERSFLLDSHYGTSGTLTDAMRIDDGNGRVDGTGAYRKTPDISADSHAGAVYMVAASAGNARALRPDHPHPVMVSDFGNTNGSVVIDISGDRLDAQFLGNNTLDQTLPGNFKVLDHFTMVKTFAQGPTVPTQLPIEDDAFPDQSEGIDHDGKYKLSWTYPALPVEQPCGYGVEEATSFGTDYSDDGSEELTAGSNSKWTSAGDWISSDHPSSGSRGYSVVYTVLQDSSLTQTSDVVVPASRVTNLTFDSFEDTEKDFDFAFVEISTDGGANFSTLETYTGNFIGQRKIDLSSYAGLSIRLRFRFTSDFVTAPPQMGWFIDDILIESSNFTPIATLAASASQYDVVGRGNGTYAYRISGLFGDCASGGASGDYSNVQQITVELGPPTFNPTASFTANPNPAEAGQSITFDASTSHDNDASGPAPEIGTYFWTFGDGTTETTSSPVTNHSYAAAGAYRVLLMITDNEGATASTESFVQVNEPQPAQIHASGAGHILISGQRANFAFEAVKDGAAFSGNLTYHDRGPNVKVMSLAVTSVQRFGNRVVFRGTCTVNKQPGFTFTVTVVDNGSGSSDTFRLQLSNGYDASGTLTSGNIEVR